jgi:hypothetical protein
MSWDGWGHGFERTLDLCDIVAETACGDTEDPAFQLDHGIVTACFHTIRKCRTARIRQRVLRLLSKQRQDGFWDAQLVAVVGQYIDDIERGPESLEQAALRDAQADEIPHWRRIQGIDVVFSAAGRNAVVTFFVPTSHADTTLIPLRKAISW